MTGRLSTCAVCRGTIEQYDSPLYRGLRWRHVMPKGYTHDPQPDDSAVSGPSRCEWCDGIEGEHADTCESPEVEAERALDDDADAWAERCRD